MNQASRPVVRTKRHPISRTAFFTTETSFLLQVRAHSSAAKTEATHLFLPQASHTPFPVGIPTTLFRNPLNSCVNTRTPP